jgi:hypothetical protein
MMINSVNDPELLVLPDTGKRTDKLVICTNRTGTEYCAVS